MPRLRDSSLEYFLFGAFLYEQADGDYVSHVGISHVCAPFFGSLSVAREISPECIRVTMSTPVHHDALL